MLSKIEDGLKGLQQQHTEVIKSIADMTEDLKWWYIKVSRTIMNTTEAYILQLFSAVKNLQLAQTSVSDTF